VSCDAQDVIPKAAAKLNQLQDSADKGKNHLDLIEVIHSVLAHSTMLSRCVVNC
jgi:hypothetical protein